MGRYAQPAPIDDHQPKAPSVSGQTSPAVQPTPPVAPVVPDGDAGAPVETDGDAGGALGGRRRRRRRRSTKKGRSRNGGTFVTEVATPLALLGATQYMKNRNARKSLKRRRSRKSYKNRSQKRRRRY
jgi:hypothetical protein